MPTTILSTATVTISNTVITTKGLAAGTLAAGYGLIENTATVSNTTDVTGALTTSATSTRINYNSGTFQ
jgi:hypothetical protein